ncbi:MAG: arginine--tRNA ligase [Bacillota bacterium]|nr:arginine--tRNA ligase [Bacillota bacterium]
MFDNKTVIGKRRAEIYTAVKNALTEAKQQGLLDYQQLPDFAVEMPREAAHGDFAVNAAMLLSKQCRKPPRDIAKLIAEHIDFTGTEVEKMEIAGPGFINFRMREGWLGRVLCEIIAEGGRFGDSSLGGGQKVQVEFVSANPTGELHMGNARGAAIGDSLVNLLNMAGYVAEREFYVNDAGNQIEKFALTLEALYLQKLGEDAPFPEDGYHGADLPPLIDGLIAELGDKWQHIEPELRREYLAEYALKRKLQAIREALADFGVIYDVWFSERSLHDSGAIKQVVGELRAAGWLLDKDGAVWLDCERMGEEKPEVLIRANGLPTYFAADIAYHRNKFERGFNTVIDIWGADHHGHVARMKGAMEAIGYHREQLEVILMQFVRLYQNGELLKMSKRTGTYVTLQELIEEVGRDAARFLFVMRSADSLIDFDMDLAKSQSNDNPVYYVQYAHARICSILAAAGCDKQPQACQGELLTHASELALIRRLADFPDEVAYAAYHREPHRVAAYVLELAGMFHNFYAQCHCIVEDAELMRARLSLVKMVAKTIERGLGALGVSAPDKM